MRWAFLLLLASPVFAGVVGESDPHGASATGFPGAYLGSVSLSLGEDPLYGSRLLDALDTHLQAVGVMTSVSEVTDYLVQSAGGSDGLPALREVLGREPVDTAKASALLLADALARPEQFLEILDGLESLKAGMGVHAGELLRKSRGTGDKKLFATLHEAGRRNSADMTAPYMAEAAFASLFDGSAVRGSDGVVLDAPADAAPEVRPSVPELGRAERP